MSPPTTNPTLYLHIGFPKTGTTFLQTEILPQIGSLCFLCKPQTELFVTDGSGLFGGLRVLFDLSPDVWEHLEAPLFAGLFGHPPKPGDPDTLISDENVTVCMKYPLDFLGPERSLRGYGPYLLSAHLREMKKAAIDWGFSTVRVLVSVRAQHTWLASAYAQSSDRWPEASQRHFEEWTAGLLDPRREYYRNGVVLDYNLLHTLLTETLGVGNILLLPYELMRDDLGEFMRRWFEFLKVSDPGFECLVQNQHRGERNVRSTGAQRWSIRPRTQAGVATIPLKPWRLFNALNLPTEIPLRWPDFRRGDNILLTQGLANRIREAYAESNRKLASRIEMDLAEFDYY